MAKLQAFAQNSFGILDPSGANKSSGLASQQMIRRRPVRLRPVFACLSPGGEGFCVTAKSVADARATTVDGGKLGARPKGSALARTDQGADPLDRRGVVPLGVGKLIRFHTTIRHKPE